MGNMLNDLLYKGRGGRRFFLRWLQRSVKGWSGRLASGQLVWKPASSCFFWVLSCAYVAAISRPSFVCLAGEPAVAGSNVTCSGVYLSSQRLKTSEC